MAGLRLLGLQAAGDPLSSLARRAPDAARANGPGSIPGGPEHHRRLTANEPEPMDPFSRSISQPTLGQRPSDIWRMRAYCDSDEGTISGNAVRQPGGLLSRFAKKIPHFRGVT